MNRPWEWAKLAGVAVGSVAVMAGCSAGLGAISSTPTDHEPPDLAIVRSEVIKAVQEIVTENPLLDPANPPCYTGLSDPPVDLGCMPMDQLIEANREIQEWRDKLIGIELDGMIQDL